LAPVKKDGKWGYINKNNEMVIPFLFMEAKRFYNGFASVKLSGENHYSDGEWGIINKERTLLFVVKNIRIYSCNS
jgi:hypothetical protein